MLLHKILVSGSAHGLAWREGPRGGGDGSGRSSDLFRPIHVELSWNEIVVQGLTILIEGSGADMAAPSEREEKGHSSRERRREREELIRREREEKGHSSSPATGPQPFTRTHLLVLWQGCWPRLAVKVTIEWVRELVTARADLMELISNMDLLEWLFAAVNARRLVAEVSEVRLCIYNA